MEQEDIDEVERGKKTNTNENIRDELISLAAEKEIKYTVAYIKKHQIRL